MRVELNKEQEMFAFEWGPDTHVADGLVRIYKYDWNESCAEREHETYIVESAREFWDKLVKEGYRLNSVKSQLAGENQVPC